MSPDILIEWIEKLNAKGFDVLEPSPGHYVAQHRVSGARTHLDATTYTEAVQEAAEEVLPMFESND